MSNLGSALDGLALNFDVLHEVMVFSDTQSLVRLSQTCKILHRMGATLLLKRGPVVINDDAEFMSLYTFLQRHRLFPNHALRNLSFCIKQVPRERVNHFVSILENSPELETLRLAYAESVLNSESPSVANAIVALTALRDLSLHRAKASTRDMLLSLYAPLERLDISYDEPEAIDPFDQALLANQIAEYHPLLICGNFASTLEELSSRFSNLLSNLPLPEAPVYANLHRLTLDDDWPFLRHWITSCPNLRELFCLSFHPDGDPTPDGPIDDDWRATREENVQDQQLHGSWTLLQEFAGDVITTYLVGLTCHVPKVRIEGDVRPGRFTVMLQETLEAVQPEYLRVRMRGSVLRLLDPEDGLCAVLHAVRTSLKRLALTLCVERSPQAPTSEADPELIGYTSLTNALLTTMQLHIPELTSLALQLGELNVPDGDEWELDIDSVLTDVAADNEEEIEPSQQSAPLQDKLEAQVLDVSGATPVTLSDSGKEFVGRFAKAAIKNVRALSIVEVTIWPPGGPRGSKHFVREVALSPKHHAQNSAEGASE